MFMRLFALLGVMFCTMGFSLESTDEENNALISEIVANDNICVQAYDNDKIYLDPARIIPTENGLFLNLNGRDYISLPKVYSDNQGCYIEDVVHVSPSCPLCGRSYIGSCTNSNCPGKENRRKYDEEKKRKKDEYNKKKNKRPDFIH